MVAAVAGCTPAPDPIPPGLAPGTVAVGRDVYQVPIGSDPDGCVFYRLYSPSRVVPQVISYRSADGGFTRDYADSVCASR